MRRALPRILMIFRPGKGNRVNWSTWTMKRSFNDRKESLGRDGNPKDFKDLGLIGTPHEQHLLLKT